MMLDLARQAANPAFGMHLLLLQDRGHIDAQMQLTDKGAKYLAEADGVGEAPCGAEAGAMWREDQVDETQEARDLRRWIVITASVAISLLGLTLAAALGS